MILHLCLLLIFIVTIANDAINGVNASFASLFANNFQDKPTIPVCAVCNEVLNCSNSSKTPLKWLQDPGCHEPLVNPGSICHLICESVTGLIIVHMHILMIQTEIRKWLNPLMVYCHLPELRM